MDFKHERPGRVRMALPDLSALVCSAMLFYFGTGLAPIAALAWFAPLPVLLLAPRVSAKTAVGVAFLAYLLGTANSWGFYLHSHDEPLPMGMLISVGFSLMFVLAVWIFRTMLRRGCALLAVATTPGATPYTRLGDWFAWRCLALTLGGLIASYPRRALTQRGLTSH